MCFPGCVTENSPRLVSGGICMVLAWGEMCKCKWIFFYFKRLEIMYFHVVVITLASADDKYQVQWPGYMKATALLVDVVVPLERKLLIYFFFF